MNTISFHFTPNKDDYIKAFRAYYFDNPYIWPVIAFLAILLPCAVVSMFMGDTVEGAYFKWLPISAFVFIAVWLLLTLVIFPNNVGTNVEKNERLSSPVEYEVNDDQILIKTHFAESKMDWGTFARVIESKEHFLLVQSASKNMFHIIPKRAFSSPEDEKAFRDLLASKIPQAGKSLFNFTKNRRTILIGALIFIVFLLVIFACLVYGFLATPS